MGLLTLLLVPGLHEHHLLVFVPRSVGSVGAGDAPRPRGGWLDASASPAAPATVLHNGDTLPRPFVAALGSPQTLTTWSQPALSMPHDRSLPLLSSFLSPPSSTLLLLSGFGTLSVSFRPPGKRDSRSLSLFLTAIPSRDIGLVSLRERISSVKGRNASDPGWRASKQRPNNRDGVSFRSTAASAARRPRRPRSRRRRRRRRLPRRPPRRPSPLPLLLSFHSTTALFFRRSTLNFLSSIEDARTCRSFLLLSPTRPLSPLFSLSYEK